MAERDGEDRRRRGEFYCGVKVRRTEHNGGFTCPIGS